MEIVDLAISEDEGGDCLPSKETSDLQPLLSHQHQNPQHTKRPEPQVDLTENLVQGVSFVPSQSSRGCVDPTLIMKEETVVSGALQFQQQLEPIGRPSTSDITNEESQDVMLVQDGETSSVLLGGDTATFGRSGLSRGGSGGNSTSGKGLQLSKCPSCSTNDIPHGQMFILERCGHGICPACVVANVTSSSNPVCPVPGCGAPVVVRDLALILHEDAWEALQARRLAAYRMRVYKGINCPGCSVWFEASSAAHDPAVIMGEAGQSGSSTGVDCRIGGGTVEGRLNRLMSTPQLLCKICSIRACRFCGSKLKRHQTMKLCGCGESKLYSANGLLEFLDEIVENPTAVENTKAPNGARGNGRGRRSGRGRSGRGKGKGVKGPQGISSKWSKGTGYGGGGDKAAADAAKAAAAEAEARADRAMAVVIDALISCLPTIGEYPEHIPELLAMVRESSLLQVVCAYLRNDSLMDIAKRKELYQRLFNLVAAFAVHELLAPLIDNVPPRSVKADYDSCSHLGAEVTGDDEVKGKNKAKVTEEAEDEPIETVSPGVAAEVDGEIEEDDEVQEVCPTKGEDQGEVDKVSVADLLASANRQAKVFAQAPGAKGKKGDAGALNFALQVTKVHDKVKNSLTYLRGIAEARTSSSAVKAITSAMGTGGVAGAGLGRKRKREELDCVEVSLESRYQDELGDSRFKVVPLLGNGLAHHLASKVSKGWVGGRARVVRISQEVSSLATSLPVQPDSSIFLRVDEDRYDVMRALITGPKDTPYEGGCFEFDILLPADYPNRPPQVQFLTTGSGRIRFNPNLYNTGKVCLSLLGTWSGPGWDSKASTLLQVLVSIQSLIFVAEPYFNEPGFESQLGTSQGRSSSRNYNNRIRNATLMFGVVEALEKQSSPMYDVIRRHFRLIKGRLLRTARAWLMEAPGGYTNQSYGSQPFGSSDGGYGGDYTSMSKVVSKVEELLSAL